MPSRTNRLFHRLCRRCAIDILSFFSLLSQAFTEWRNDNASLLAAAIAYYGLFSLSPILIILVAILGIIIGQSEVENAILEEVGRLIGPNGVEVVKDVIAQAINPAHSFSATALSLVIVAIGATGLFLQTKRALHIVWSVSHVKGMGIISAARSYIISFVLLISLGIMLFISALVTAVLIPASRYLASMLSLNMWFLQMASFLISFAFVTALFAVVYKALSGIYLSWGEVLRGSVLAAVLFSAGNVVIEIYVGISDIGSVYGAAASIVVFLFWVYYSAQMFFFGAEFIKVYRRKRDS